MGEPSVGQEFAGYHLDEVLGRGGMGVVYLATDLRLKRPVALKVIASAHSDDEGFRRRFQRESEIAASLDHPNLIPIYHAGEEGGCSFLTMKYVEGTDLKEVLDTEGGLDRLRAAQIIAQAAAGLDAAHEVGLVHRDVKPANLLLQASETGEHVYVTDFGLTKRMDADNSMTATGMLVGTVNYIAPEQINGEAIDARTDVYALGGVLHHILTGDVPYPKPTAMATIAAQLSEPPPVPSARRKDLPVELDAVVIRAMAKDRDDRFPSAGDLGRAALAAARGQEPTVAEHNVARGKAAPPPPVARRPPPPPAPVPGPAPSLSYPGPPGAGAPSQARHQGKAPTSLWVLWPILSFGILSAVGFGMAAERTDVRKWLFYGLGYSGGAIACFATTGALPEDTAGSTVAALVFLAIWIAASVHAVRLRAEYKSILGKRSR